MRVFFLLLFLAVSLAHGWLMVKYSDQQRRGIIAKEEMRKFAVVTIRLFQRDGQPPNATSFWAEVGRKEPLPDPWGSPYRMQLSSSGERFFEWSSAGSDRIFGTVDDLKYPVPYGDGVNIDLTKPNLDPSLDNRVNDAR